MKLSGRILASHVECSSFNPHHSKSKKREGKEKIQEKRNKKEKNKNAWKMIKSGSCLTIF